MSVICVWPRVCVFASLRVIREHFGNHFDPYLYHFKYPMIIVAKQDKLQRQLLALRYTINVLHFGVRLI